MDGLPKRFARVVPLAAFAALTLAGCGGGSVSSSATRTSSPTPTTSPAVSASPSTSPSPTVPAFDPHPALDAMFITTSGIGPLTVGAPVAGNSGEAMVTWDSEFCSFAETEDEPRGPDDLGRWVATYPVIPGRGTRPFSVATSGGSASGYLFRIDIHAAQLATPEGIHSGSPLSDLVGAYPSLVTGTAGWDDFHVYWISDAEGTIVFETNTYNSDGTTGPAHVGPIRVLAPGIDPDFTVAESDDIAGGCL